MKLLLIDEKKSLINYKERKSLTLSGEHLRENENN